MKLSSAPLILGAMLSPILASAVPPTSEYADLAAMDANTLFARDALKVSLTLIH
jgi:hypothetical protein